MEELDMGLREESSWRGTVSYRPVPSRSQINFKVCLSFIASVVISTAASVMVVHYHLGPPATVSCAEKQPGYQMQWDENQTQKFQPEEKDKPHTHLTGYQMQKDDNQTQNVQPKQKDKPHAYLTVFKPPPKERKKDNLVVHWNILKQNYIGGGMKYNDSDDSLFIPEDGFYVIYLQMSYRSMHSFNICNNGVLHLTQSVAVLRMRHADRPVDIITNWETVSCDKDVWFKTIHNMARVLLRKGDRLQVRHSLNADSLIDFAGTPGTKTFWGVYLD